MKRLVIGILTVLMLIGCGQSYEETKRLSRQQRLQLAREEVLLASEVRLEIRSRLSLFLGFLHHLGEFPPVVDTANEDCSRRVLSVVNRRGLGIDGLAFLHSSM